MSKQIDLGVVTCDCASRESKVGETKLAATFYGDKDADPCVNLYWGCDTEAAMVSFSPGQRYRVILERIDG